MATAGRYIAIERGAFDVFETAFPLSSQAEAPPVFPLADRLEARVLLDLHRLRNTLPSLHDKLQ